MQLDSALEPHPDLLRLLEKVVSAGLKPPNRHDVREVRAYLQKLDKLAIGDSQPVQTEEYLTIKIAGQRVRCKLYRPDTSPSCEALLLYCHGGGFRHGNLEGSDPPLRQIARASGVSVLSVGYSLCPEHPFPQAHEEISGILRMLLQGSEICGFTPSKLAIAGDSAGANLALSAVLANKEQDLERIAYILLFYGVFSKDVHSPSWKRLSGFGGHGITAESMTEYWSTYAVHGENDWRVQPLFGDLDELPKTRLLVGNLDPLMDQTFALYDKMLKAGNDVSMDILSGMTHGFIRFNELVPIVRKILEKESQTLAKAMAPDGPL